MTDTWQPDRWPSFDRGGLTVTSHHPRNRDFPIRALLAGGPQQYRDRRWRRWRPVWDQVGGTCVPHAGTGLVVTTPNLSTIARRQRRALDAQLPYAMYPEMQRVDEWPGESPAYEGTSTLAMGLILKQRGLCREFRWCFGLDDVLQTLSRVGPVATGLNWLADAAYPTPDGRPDRRVGQHALGGHETYLYGIDADNREVLGWNSWGPGFGDGGRYRWSWTYLEERLADQGDALVLVV